MNFKPNALFALLLSVAVGFSSVGVILPFLRGNGSRVKQPSFADIAKLGELANAFFRSLPGEDVPVPHDPVIHLGTGGVPVLEPDLQLAATTPLPKGSGAPVTEVPTPHASSLASPAGYSAPLPQVGSTDPRNSLLGAAPSAPYYFLGHATALPSETAGVQPVPLENLVTPQAQNFPGQAEVNELLKEITSSHRGTETQGAKGLGQGFYFVDSSATPVELSQSEKPAYQEIAPSPHPQFDVNAVRRDFPILQERVNGHQLA